MSKTTVEVEWLNPNQSMARYADSLRGFTIQRSYSRPQRNYYVLGSEKEAESLKAHLDKQIPEHSYRHIDSDGKPMLDPDGKDVWTRDPTISVVETYEKAN